MYGGSRVSYEIAENDELPHELTSQLWNQPLGLLITAVATLLLANTLNLESISTAGSAGFLLIFAVKTYRKMPKPWATTTRHFSVNYRLSISALATCGDRDCF